jgi:hypothetical protein
MNTIWWLIMAVMTEPYHKTKPIGLAPERTTENVMPFEPLPGVTDKAS